MTHPEQTHPLDQSSRELLPPQDQLRRLGTTILSHEPATSPGNGLPSPHLLEEFNSAIGDFEVLNGPPTYDGSIAPSSTLLTPDSRVIWLSIFRNADTSQIIKQHIIIIDPPKNRKVREEIPREDYDLFNVNDKFTISRFGAGPVIAPDVDTLEELIRASKLFNIFE